MLTNSFVPKNWARNQPQTAFTRWKCWLLPTACWFILIIVIVWFLIWSALVIWGRWYILFENHAFPVSSSLERWNIQERWGCDNGDMANKSGDTDKHKQSWIGLNSNTVIRRIIHYHKVFLIFDLLVWDKNAFDAYCHLFPIHLLAQQIRRNLIPYCNAAPKLWI